jgi:hypothetical protein
MHEAAHAVAAHAVGAKIVCATVTANAAGYVVIDNYGCEPASLELDFRAALVALAGPAGQRLVEKSSWFVTFITSAWGDLGAAEEAVGTDQVWKVFLPLAHRLVVQRRRAVEVLAKRLLREKLLEGEEVVRVLNRADRTLARSIPAVRAIVPPGTPGYQA